jgi:uncharacterized membrane protein
MIMTKTLNCLRKEIKAQQADGTSFDALFWVLTFIICFQALIGSLNMPMSVFEGSWQVLLLIFTAIAARFSYCHLTVFRSRAPLCYLQYLIVGMIAFGIFARFYNIDTLSLWFDEYHQLKLLRNREQKPLLFSVMTELQLPLYYMVQKSQMVIFGESALSLRFWSLLSGSLLPLACWLGLRKLKFNNCVVLLAVSYLALHPFLIFKSLVIRPYSLYALFVGFFWIYFLLSLKDDRYHFRVAISLLLCFLTLSFLTCILVVALMIAIFLISLLEKKALQEMRKYKGILWGFLAALPLNLYLTFINIQAHWQSPSLFWNTINKSQLFSTEHQMDFFNIALLTINLSKFSAQYLLIFLLVIFGISAVVYLKFSKLKIDNDSRALAITSIVIALYPVIFVPIFASIATYSHGQIRFAIAGVVLFGLWLPLIVQFCLDLINNLKYKFLSDNVEKITIILFIFAFLSMGTRMYSFIFQSPTPFKRPHWKGFYELIQESPPSVLRYLPGTFYYFSPAMVGKTYYAVESEHYFAQANLARSNLPDLSEDVHQLKLSNPFAPRYYFILLSPYWSDQSFDFPEIEGDLFNEETGYKIFDVEEDLHLHVIGFKNDEDLNERLFKFFEYVYENSTSFLQKKSMLYYLIMYAHHFNDEHRLEIYTEKWHNERFEAHWIEVKSPK